MIARPPLALAALFALAWLAPHSFAQVDEEPVSSLKDLEAVYGREFVAKQNGAWQPVKIFTDISYMVSQNDIGDKDRRALEVLANYYVFRVTWREYASDPDQMERAINDFKKFYRDKMARAKNQEMTKFLNKKLVESFKRVFERDFLKNRLTSVNAAQLLPGLGEGKSEEISSFLVQTIKDPKMHQAIKLYAIKALKDYFPLSENPVDKLADRERVHALTSYIEQKWDIKEPNKERLEERMAAVSFLRREAIQVLALAQLPIVPKLDAKTRMDGQVAVTLLRVLARNELAPPPPAPGKVNSIAVMGLAERTYASFGLCDFRPDPTSGYVPDLAVYAVGHCLSEFIEAYVNDSANLVKDDKEFSPKGERRTPQLPWKTLAGRWKESLDNLVKTTEKTKNEAAHNQAKALLTKAAPMLNQMLIYKEVKLDQSDTFSRYVNDLRSPSTPVFKGAPEVKVKLGY